MGGAKNMDATLCFLSLLLTVFSTGIRRQMYDARTKKIALHRSSKAEAMGRKLDNMLFIVVDAIEVSLLFRQVNVC